MPDFTLEKAHLRNGPVAGVDEAGRGPLAGPVLAAAVILDPRRIPDGLDDSKALSAARREELYAALVKSAVIGVAAASVFEITQRNILHASLLAMGRAVARLAVKPATALIDGNRAPHLPCAAIPVIGGDARSLSIAAASIVAKVTRDRLMRRLGLRWPGYGFEIHMGYPTRAHRDALSRLGPTPHHRPTFADLHKVLWQDSELIS